ncbi:hypothetical protein PORY_001570 [Pneumocystis oryctolagi]|uniref:Uncharacterized protein n=1 Tax=Pneumocystis oryctolagi TaxID=42067 RepID=A0ACB7CBN5_9ASCO|nr:hypothetical protein PORY_001570 [Pneumocystis oryctolagi]
MVDEDKKITFRIAKALYDFHGEKEYNELSLTAGDYVIVNDDEVNDIWVSVTLERDPTQQGLVPREYLIYQVDSSFDAPCLSPRNANTTDLVNESRFVVGESFQENFEDKDGLDTVGSRMSSRFSFLQKTLNRLFTFAITDIEGFLIFGSLNSSEYVENSQRKYISEADTHYVDDGPKWKSKVESFDVYVHDPQKVFCDYSKDYVTYKITSCFSTNRNSEDVIKVTVERRYSQFEWLHHRLLKKYSLLVWPSFPEKQIMGKFDNRFLEKRRMSLERYIRRVVKHPVARYSDLLNTFLTCEDSLKFSEKMKEHDNDLIVGQRFFENVYYPDFNVDKGDAPILSAFSYFINSLDCFVPSIISSFKDLRYSMIIGADKLKLFGTNIHKLISVDEPFSTDNNSSGRKNVWCHKDECLECKKLTNMLRMTADALISCSNVRKLWAVKHSEEIVARLNEWKHPAKDTAFLYKIYLTTLKRYLYVDEIDPFHDNESFEELRQRCDTIFNIIMAEINRIHEEKIESFRSIVMELLNQEILVQKEKLAILENVRSKFE